MKKKGKTRNVVEARSHFCYYFGVVTAGLLFLLTFLSFSFSFSMGDFSGPPPPPPAELLLSFRFWVTAGGKFSVFNVGVSVAGFVLGVDEAGRSFDCESCEGWG